MKWTKNNNNEAKRYDNLLHPNTRAASLMSRHTTAEQRNRQQQAASFTKRRDAAPRAALLTFFCDNSQVNVLLQVSASGENNYSSFLVDSRNFASLILTSLIREEEW